MWNLSSKFQWNWLITRYVLFKENCTYSIIVLCLFTSLTILFNSTILTILVTIQPLYGVLAEDLLLQQPSNAHTNTGVKGYPRCYTYWGWCDVDGIVGRHLATILDDHHYRQHQQQGRGVGPGIGQGQGSISQGLGQSSLTSGSGPLTTTPTLSSPSPSQGLGGGLSPMINVCTVNTTIHTFYAQGMWQSPIFSGQLSVICNNQQSRWWVVSLDDCIVVLFIVVLWCRTESKETTSKQALPQISYSLNIISPPSLIFHPLIM